MIPEKPIEYTGDRMPIDDGDPRQDWLEKRTEVKGVIAEIRKAGLWYKVKAYFIHIGLEGGINAINLVKTDDKMINLLVKAAVFLLKLAAQRYKKIYVR